VDKNRMESYPSVNNNSERVNNVNSINTLREHMVKELHNNHAAY